MKYFFVTASAIGLLICWFGALSYVWHIVDWGMRFSWHFEGIRGWGFAFLYSLELIVLGVATYLIALGGVYKYKDQLPRNLQPRTFWIVMGMCLLVLAAAICIEYFLQKTFP